MSLETSAFPWTKATPLFRTHGESYDPYRIACYYHMAGHALRANVNEDLGIDVKFNWSCVLPPDHNKGRFVQIQQRTFEKLPSRNRYFPHAQFEKVHYGRQFHPEALIGRVDKLSNPAHKDDPDFNPAFLYVKTFGALACDAIILNDCLDMWQSDESEHVKARNYLMTAMEQDFGGANILTKPQSGVPATEQIEVQPRGSFSFFFQPVPMPSNWLDTGAFRRSWLTFSKINEKERRAWLGYPYPWNEELFEEWRLFIFTMWDGPGAPKTKLVDGKEIPNPKHKPWVVSDQIHTKAREYTNQLLDDEWSRRFVTDRFIHNFEFTLHNYLLRMSMIQAGTRYDTVVKPDDVDNAFNDLYPLWIGLCSYVGWYTEGGEYGRIPPAATRGLHYARPKQSVEDWVLEVSRIYDVPLQTAEGWKDFLVRFNFLKVNEDGIIIAVERPM